MGGSTIPVTLRVVAQKNVQEPFKWKAPAPNFAKSNARCTLSSSPQTLQMPCKWKVQNMYTYRFFSIVCPGLSFSLSRVSVWHEPQICFPRKLTCFSKACLVLQTILTLTFTKLGLFKSMSFPSLVLPFFAFWLTNWTVLLRGDMQSICLVHRTWKSLRGHSISAFQHAVQVVAG